MRVPLSGQGDPRGRKGDVEMKSLRFVRMTLALAAFVTANLFFFGLAQGAAILFKVQLLPAILALNVAAIASVVLVTLLFGRVYCSVVCPMGVFQDIVIWIRRRVTKGRCPGAACRGLRWVSLGLTVVLVALGFVSLGALLDGYSLYGRIATQVFRPGYSLVHNLVAGLLADAGHPVLFREAVFVRGCCALAVAAVGLAGTVALAWWKGRLFCNALCPVGAALALLSKRPLVKLSIDAGACVGCGLCAKTCKCGAIDVKAKRIDNASCVRCCDCLGVCRKSAIGFKVT